MSDELIELAMYVVLGAAAVAVVVLPILQRRRNFQNELRGLASAWGARALSLRELADFLTSVSYPDPTTVRFTTASRKNLWITTKDGHRHDIKGGMVINMGPTGPQAQGGVPITFVAEMDTMERTLGRGSNRIERTAAFVGHFWYLPAPGTTVPKPDTDRFTPYRDVLKSIQYDSQRLYARVSFPLRNGADDSDRLLVRRIRESDAWITLSRFFGEFT